MACIAAGVLWAFWHRPLISAGVASLAVGSTAAYWAFNRRHLRRLAAVRVGEDLGSFARHANPRVTDWVVVKAVYEQIQEYLRPEINAFPLRWEDRLSEDLKIDQGDLEDIIAVEVAERTGRSLNTTLATPFFGNVRTVGDLVLFFSASVRVDADELLDGYEEP